MPDENGISITHIADHIVLIWDICLNTNEGLYVANWSYLDIHEVTLYSNRRSLNPVIACIVQVEPSWLDLCFGAVSRQDHLGFRTASAPFKWTGEDLVTDRRVWLGAQAIIIIKALDIVFCAANRLRSSKVVTTWHVSSFEASLRAILRFCLYEVIRKREV